MADRQPDGNYDWRGDGTRDYVLILQEGVKAAEFCDALFNWISRNDRGRAISPAAEISRYGFGKVDGETRFKVGGHEEGVQVLRRVFNDAIADAVPLTRNMALKNTLNFIP